jgi:hypothetical protein
MSCIFITPISVVLFLGCLLKRRKTENYTLLRSTHLFTPIGACRISGGVRRPLLRVKNNCYKGFPVPIIDTHKVARRTCRLNGFFELIVGGANKVRQSTVNMVLHQACDFKGRTLQGIDVYLQRIGIL